MNPNCASPKRRGVNGCSPYGKLGMGRGGGAFMEKAFNGVFDASNLRFYALAPTTRRLRQVTAKRAREYWDMVIIELDSCGIPSYGVFEMGGYRGWVHGQLVARQLWRKKYEEERKV
ncbi:hypothetical protein EYC84_002529 [Monilinia fructicola]|uniref:Uncharacterized protein n=1 Tax=Monilinia fructicola TaxID=38448 RepID=A0A5M9JLS1_MONFR|nr:hypothetical protein EYC84_002529 [Monilinia fructicola]